MTAWEEALYGVRAFSWAWYGLLTYKKKKWHEYKVLGMFKQISTKQRARTAGYNARNSKHHQQHISISTGTLIPGQQLAIKANHS